MAQELLKVVDDSTNQSFEVERQKLLSLKLKTRFTHEGTTYEIRGLNRNDGITGHPSVNKPYQYIWRTKSSVRFKQRYAAGYVDSSTSSVHVVSKF